MGLPTLRLMGIGVVNPCCKSGHQSRIIEIAMTLVKGVGGHKPLAMIK